MTDDNLASLAARASGLVPRHGRAILGITGPPGGGKTTVAQRLIETLTGEQAGDCQTGPTSAARPSLSRPSTWVAYVPMDGFHLADVQLERLGLSDRKGAPETFDDAGYAALLGRIRQGDDDVIYAPGFERELEQPIAASIAIPRQACLVITEGNYLLLDQAAWPQARANLDEVWYVDLDAEARVARLIARHVAFGKTPSDAHAWVMRSDEANARLIVRTRRGADLFVDSARLLRG